jgi:rhodanese-related sulfurtransferase
MSGSRSDPFAGEVSAGGAWDGLKGSPEATLVDVRTAAEWKYVGVPALDSIGRSLVLIEWERYPNGDRVPDFVERLKAALDEQGAGPDAPLYFICRSGSRSRHAAIAATGAGYRKCFNVTEGFEGKLDGDGHRQTAGSWKAEGLPWVQS